MRKYLPLMLLSMDSFESPAGGSAVPARRSLQWRSQYDGVVAVAYVDSEAIAGISGPWSGKYALTWWRRPMPMRELELHDTLGSAQREVEEWALRMHDRSYTLPLPEAPAAAVVAATPAASAAANDGAPARTLMGRVRALFGQQPSSSSHEKIEPRRGQRTLDESDLDGLHFGANE